MSRGEVAGASGDAGRSLAGCGGAGAVLECARSGRSAAGRGGAVETSRPLSPAPRRGSGSLPPLTRVQGSLQCAHTHFHSSLAHSHERPRALEPRGPSPRPHLAPADLAAALIASRQRKRPFKDQQAAPVDPQGALESISSLATPPPPLAHASRLVPAAEAVVRLGSGALSRAFSGGQGGRRDRIKQGTVPCTS